MTTDRQTAPYEAPIAVALTGASGVQYGLRLIECLVAARHEIYVMISKAAHRVIDVETDLALPAQPVRLAAELSERFGAGEGQIQCFSREDWMAPVASGSGRWRSLVICPCSTGTLSAIACGASDNLIERGADVALKERRQLIVVPRETPLSAVHLENMLTLTRMGAVVMPAAPGFYHRPDSVEAMIDFIVARILNQLGIEQSLLPAWGGKPADA
ncbi:flavin prenyltransferase UbiX [Salinicola halophilus]|uniref:flavin prenyltransferase UbiX n=1 Tax=Salinicola halophilus TaxID=184065 RepID=UPI000DA12086|nr:flavin prenyltransferase UbiX [Salinicola halophilus]